MKKSLLVIISIISLLTAMAQQKSINYTLEWKKIDSLLNKKGLNKSALNVTEKLYQTAKSENKSAQMIKALIYIASIKESLSENAAIENISLLKEELKSTQIPVTNLLHALLATQYKNYYNQHRWKISSQNPITTLPTSQNPNMDTWSVADFYQVISFHFEQSLQHENELTKIELDNYEPIILKGNSSNLRPTLFDLLAWNALDFFTSDDIYLTQPVYQFIISDTVAFAKNTTFVEHSFVSKDIQSSRLKALKIYQSLLRFHLTDVDPTALLDADIQRLAFIHEFSEIPKKDQQYQLALEQLYHQYPEHPLGALAKFKATALWYENTSELTPPLNTSADRFARKTIVSRLQNLIKKHPKTNAAIESENLLAVIQNPEISLQTENVIIPNEAFLSLVNFRNISKIYYRIIPITNNKKILDNDYMDTPQWKKWCNTTPIRDSFQLLPDAGDYRPHSTEIKINGLPPGTYALIASSSPDFKLQKNAICIQFFQASSISYINRGDDYFFLHRKTGKPLAKLAIQIWESAYDNKLAKRVFVKKEKTITNKVGFIHLKRTSEYVLEAFKDKDTLIAKDFTYPRFSYIEPVRNKTPMNGLLYTDRKIYRPGQTIFFKGIFFKDFGEDKKTSVFNFFANMVLINANGEEIDTVTLSTNTFGSVQGKFKLPTNQLTGNFQLKEKQSGATFDFVVEEYKRPTFQLSIDNIKKAYRLEDTVVVSGDVVAFAGNTLAGTTVKYRITRLPKYDWYRISPFQRSQSASTIEIGNGTILTDVNGEFQFSFVAKSNAEQEENYRITGNQYYDFQINLEATDQSGETNTQEKNVTIGSASLQLQLDVPSHAIAANRFTDIPVNAVNTFGEPQQIKADWTIQLLSSPKRPIKPRYWEIPDTATMTQSEFLNSFPNDAWMDETNPENWPIVKTIIQQTDTLQNGKLILPEKIATPGWYLITVKTTDIYGTNVSNKAFIRLYDAQNPMPDLSNFAESLSENLVTTPGETVSVSIGSQAPKYWLISTIDKGDNINLSTYNSEEIVDKRKTLTLQIKESDRGGFTIIHAFILHNRMFTINQKIDVPWTNKTLEVTTQSFRSKIEPGSKETWSLNIKSNNPEHQNTEILTSLYDASLDQFILHQWQIPELFSQHGATLWNTNPNFDAGNSNDINPEPLQKEVPYTAYDKWLWELSILRRVNMLEDRIYNKQRGMMEMESKMMPSPKMTTGKVTVDSAVAVQAVKDEEVIPIDKNQQQVLQVKPRKNFEETAFFFPQLTSDSLGNVQFSFTMPDALTQWKWQSIAHTKEMAMGRNIQKIITQKELMVQPNMPRILREGDKITLTARVSNLTNEEISGSATLDLLDPDTDKPVDGLFKNIFPQQFFTVGAGQNDAVAFTIEIPINYNKPLKYKIIAIAKNHSDGEENILPVLSNRILVTESIPLTMKGNGTSQFKMPGLTNAQTGSLTHHRLTVEYSANPAWNAILALPYLMEFPYECAEQNFNRFYANALASSIANSSPRIKAIFDQWKSRDTSALISNLLKNQELKSILIEETPWVFEAQQESIQRKNIARLFDMVSLSKELTASLDKLKNMQSENGAFSWFKGCPDDRFITQYIVTGMAKLLKMRTISNQEHLQTIKEIIFNALKYLDQSIQQEYLNAKKSSLAAQKTSTPSWFQLQYLYMNSFYGDRTTEKTVKEAIAYFTNLSTKTWVKQNVMGKSMTALIAHRNKNEKTAKDILKSLHETSIISPTLGMYWKENIGGYFWQEAAIETQSLAIEAFQEISKDTSTVEPLILWLLNKKKVQHWSTSKATADAIYAILNTRPDIIMLQPNISILAGNKLIQPSIEKQEAGSGYFKYIVEGREIEPTMGNIAISVSGNAQSAITWGAAFWQYFENADKITQAGNALKVHKQCFIQKYSDKGIVLEPISDSNKIKVGDKLTIRLTVYSEQNLEYVHLKDIRPAGTAPEQVLSGYQWRNGLGFYQTTTDAGNNFFFNWLPKGTHIIDYELFVSHNGTFSMGVSNIQSMYAPEYTGRSAGGIIKIGE